MLLLLLAVGGGGGAPPPNLEKLGQIRKFSDNQFVNFGRNTW